MPMNDSKRSTTVTLGLVSALAAVGCGGGGEESFSDDSARHCVDTRTDKVVEERACATGHRGAGMSPFLYYYGGTLIGRSYYGSRLQGYSRAPIRGRTYTTGYQSYSGYQTARSRSASNARSVSRGSMGTIGSRSSGRVFG